ncbi:MAG: hypothetical protein ACREVN_04655 [Gammaproteobacteria bacterium]
MQNRYRECLLAGALIALLAGCENLPYDRETQATAAGAAVGVAAGAALGDSLFDTLLGGALGAGAGYLIGAETDWLGDDDIDTAEAQEAVRNARNNPATEDDVENSDTGDLNGDGFVTTDELIAMEDAGLSEDEIMDRLEATDQVFDLTPEQSEELVAAGVSEDVVDQLESINREERDRLLSDASVIGRPAE